MRLASLDCKTWINSNIKERYMKISNKGMYQIMTTNNFKKV